ncbi:MAG: hypothetical protein AB1757_11515 [Acidobacteriota bacterium]
MRYEFHRSSPAYFAGTYGDASKIFYEKPFIVSIVITDSLASEFPMKLRIKSMLLWFTAGIGGFALGFLFGRATAKPVYLLLPLRESEELSKKSFRLALLRTAIFGITCGIAIVCAAYYLFSPKESESVAEKRIISKGETPIPTPPYIRDDWLMYPTDPPKYVNPDRKNFESWNLRQKREQEYLEKQLGMEK